MKKKYFAIVTQEETGYSVTFPEVGNIATQGENFAESIKNAQELLQFEIDDTEKIPENWNIEKLAQLATNAVLMPIECELPANKTVRVNIAVQEHKLTRIDAFCKLQGFTRSRMLIDAAEHYIKCFEKINDI